jgi:hypothetical protein
MSKMQLATRCTSDYSYAHVQALEAMYDAEREVTFKTFSKHVDWKPVAEDLGYIVKAGKRGLRLSRDRAVSFTRSKWKGQRCYAMEWSRIDHVFLPEGARI